MTSLKMRHSQRRTSWQNQRKINWQEAVNEWGHENIGAARLLKLWTDWGKLQDGGKRGQMHRRIEKASTDCWNSEKLNDRHEVTMFCFFFCLQLMTQVTDSGDGRQTWHHNKCGAWYADSLLLMSVGQKGHVMELDWHSQFCGTKSCASWYLLSPLRYKNRWLTNGHHQWL